MITAARRREMSGVLHRLRMDLDSPKLQSDYALRCKIFFVDWHQTVRKWSASIQIEIRAELGEDIKNRA